MRLAFPSSLLTWPRSVLRVASASPPGPAQAAVATQRVMVAPHRYFTSAAIGSTANHTISAAFDRFDPGLGRLRAVTFSYHYVFSSSVLVDGPGGGSVGLGGPFRLFGQELGGNDGSGPGRFTIAGSLQMKAGIPLAEFVGSGSYDFDFLSYAGSGGSMPAGTEIEVDLSLIAPSSVTVTYSYERM